ncbi:MAG: erythromycin esterase family protein [Candidatus Aphodosoma sp.]
MKTIIIKLKFVVICIVLCNITIFAQEQNVQHENQNVYDAILANMTFRDSVDCGFISQIAKGKDLIILGESGHFDAVTIESKSKMVQCLIDGFGFDTYADEATAFLISYMWSNPKYEAIRAYVPVTNLKHVYGGIDREYKEICNLLNSNKIELFGITSQGSVLDITALQWILSSYCDVKNIGVDFTWLFRTYQKKLFSNEKIPENDIELFHKYMNKIFYTADKLLEQNPDSIDLQAIAQYEKNFRIDYQWMDNFEEKAKVYETDYDPSLIQYVSMRDMMMADNILWYMERFPDKKIVVNCANYHAMKNISETENDKDMTMYMKTPTMGEWLHKTLGNRMYTLLFTAYGFPNYVLGGELEKRIHNHTDKNFGFIDFTPLKPKYEYVPFDCNVIRKKYGPFMYMCDGLIYVKKERQVTM